ncbi:MAG: ribonuclease Y [Acholeplasmatales bacterium]|nr:ribonuclease Y [Acholeplasmatales bacterium]
MQIGLAIALIVLALVLGFVGGYLIRVKSHEKTIAKSKQDSEKILADAEAEAEKKKKESIFEAKQEIAALKQEADKDIRERKNAVVELESKLNQREDTLDRRAVNLDRREEMLNSKEIKIDEKKAELEQQNNRVEAVLRQQEQKLVEIAGLTRDEAKKIIMDTVKESMKVEIATYIKEEEEKARLEVKTKAKNVLALAIQKYAGETAGEATVSTVSLPVEEMKGRIIGREGRNIRTIESLTGVDLIIDDTPEAVVLSGFDPVRREIAKRSLEILVSDGRIHPARIEEVVERCRGEVEMVIREMGEEAVFKAGVGKIHPDLVRLIGRLNFRTSYGQNVLKHSIETAMIAGKLASEIGENEVIARRAGLLHDIGKAVDHEIEGSHVEIGVELASKYREPKEVIDAIASHHEDVAPKSIIAVLVAAADALSSARPGARSDSLENYTKRLENLEAISNSIKGVSSSFAIQAGREVRVIVNPSEVDDLSTISIARQIKEEIENKLSYPGTIKVTVIRETRAVDVAK